MNPFARSKALFAAIQAIMGSFMGSDRQRLLSQLGPYKSRGKGRGSVGRNYFKGGGSKYEPHQGKQEIARRAARGY